jgi:N-acetylmuramoyl-L-alanine amidase CwlA
MNIQITKKTGTANTTVCSTRKPKYIAIHYTAGVTSKAGTALGTASYFAKETTEASADFIVDDGTFVQYNPDPTSRYCWAVGAKKKNPYTKGGSLWGVCKNANSVSIEICSTNKTGKITSANDDNYSFTDKAVDNGAKLTAYLMKTYGVDIDHVVRHYDVTGKLCPGIKGWNADSGSETAWTDFKTRVLSYFNQDSTAAAGTTTSKTDTTETNTKEETTVEQRYNSLAEMPDYAKDTIKKLCKKGYLGGYGTKKDDDGLPADLDLSIDMIRMFTINDRAGVYGD